MTLILQEYDFYPVDLLTNFLSDAEEMVAVQTFLEVVHTRSLPCGCHYIRWFIFSWRIFLKTRLNMLNGGKEKLYSPSQGWRNASVAMRPGSGFHAMSQGSWWQSLNANRSRFGCPICVTISWKTETSSFHSELPLAFLDSQSACTFRALGRYSADIAICLLRR